MKSQQLRSNESVMLAARFEQNRDRKRDDGAETDPPGKFHHRQPARLRIKLAAENAGNLVRQAAQNGHYNEAHDHGDDITGIVSAPFSEHSTQENAEQRPVCVAEDPE